MWQLQKRGEEFAPPSGPVAGSAPRLAGGTLPGAWDRAAPVSTRSTAACKAGTPEIESSRRLISGGGFGVVSESRPVHCRCKQTGYAIK